MLTEIYIEALLVNEELADQVWEAWDKGEISDLWAAWIWLLITLNAKQTDNFLLRFVYINGKAKPAKRRGRKIRGAFDKLELTQLLNPKAMLAGLGVNSMVPRNQNERPMRLSISS